MNREQAETLLAALVADELDESQRGALLAYLKTDPALAERLGDMRLAAGLLREGLEQASAASPAALEESQRAELLALIEREPITAVIPGTAGEGEPRRGHRPIFSFRLAGAVAACAALGVGLVGLMLPELGEARRTARRMQNTQEDAAEYAYGDFGNNFSTAMPEYNMTRKSMPSIRGGLHGVDGTLRTDRLEIFADRSESGFGISSDDDIDLAGGSRVVITDGRGVAGQLIDETAGTLALGDDQLVDYTTQYFFRGYEGRKGVTAGTPGPAADGWHEAPDTGLASMIEGGLPDPIFKRNQSAGDVLALTDGGGEGLNPPAIVSLSGETDRPSDIPVIPLAPAPTPGPTDENRYRSVDLGGQQGQQGSGLLGMEGLVAEGPGAVAKPTETGKPGAGSSVGSWTGSTVWGDGYTDFEPSTAFDTRYANGHLIPDSVGFDKDEFSNGRREDRRGVTLGDRITAVDETRRLSDNYRRVQEEGKEFADQLGRAPSFDNAPGFDLNDALSNTSSGGGGGGAGGSGNLFDNDQMSQAIANTAAEKAKLAEEALRSGQLDAAVQLYEDATLLDPGNTANHEKLAEAKDKLNEQMRPLDALDKAGVYRSVSQQAAVAEYEKAMAAATKALENQDFSAAQNAIVEARATLAREKSVLDTDDFNSRVSRAEQLSELSRTTEERVNANQLSSIDFERSRQEKSIASETEQRKTEEVQGHLRRARDLQREKNYDASLAELDAALFLDPDNDVIKALRGMVQDTAYSVESFDLKRQRDLEIAGGTLQNIEATTPFEDILTYPGQWPELSALRLEDGQDIDIVTELPVPEPQPEPEITRAAENEKKAGVIPPVNPWVLTERDAQSTFALDTDTASYELTRRTIREQAQLPPVASVRMEEFVNRFDYQYPTGRDAHDTFTVHAEAGPAPFAGSNGGEAILLKVGVRGRVVARDQMKPAHYVFVIDASGSMAREDRLPLVQQSLAMLLGQLSEKDTVSLVSYETRPYLLLEHAPASDALGIMQAAATIQTGGSTNLTDGLKLGYQIAGKHFAPGSVNRVILCSDGVANVGDNEAKQMLDAVKAYRKQGVTLMTVGVGVDGQTAGQAATGAERFNDGLMEQLANRGDGQYVYLGSAEDAQRQFVEDLAATRPTIAYDAKIQVDFDPSRVRRYRLIGYENRDIADRDFRNDAVDAGEVGSGQSATALYEIELWPTHRRRPAVQANEAPGKLATVYVRYRDAQSNTVEETATAVTPNMVRERTVSDDPRFYLAACAAEFAELLRNSEHAAGGSYTRLHQIAREVAEALPLDKDAAELAELIGRAQGLPRAGQ
jgi:Ca-activated chloride channel family protein